MAWFELDASKITKLRKFRDLRVELHWSVNEALGFLSSFWGAVVELNESGEISDWDPDYLCELTHVTPEGETTAQVIWDSLVKNQWIIASDDRFLIADYIDMAGSYLIRKYHNSDRQKLVNIWATHGRMYGRGGGGDGAPRVGDKGDSSGEKFSGSEKEVKRISGLSGGDFVASEQRSALFAEREKVSPTPPSKRELINSPLKTFPPPGSSPPTKSEVHKKPERRKTEQRPGVKVLIDRFHEKLRDKFGETPAGIHYGAAGREFFRLLGNYPITEINLRLDNWFRSTDPWIVKNGFSPNMFFTKFNLLKDGPIANSNSVGTHAKRFIDGLATAGPDKEFPGG